MAQIVLDFPEETLLALKVPANEAGQLIRLLAAVKLFELERLSSGAAATLAGLPQPAFLAKLADLDVAVFSLTEEQFRQETRLA